MSSDNGYVIRKHPRGGYAAVHYFASDDDTREAVATDRQYPSAMEAYFEADSWPSEYGAHIHPECQEARA